MVINLLVILLHCGNEGLFLDVLSFDGLIPFVVKSIHGCPNLSNVSHESVNFVHLFSIGIAGIINEHNFCEIKCRSKEFNHSVPNSAFQISLEHALAWVFHAPFLSIISNSFKLASFHVFPVSINQTINNSLDF